MIREHDRVVLSTDMEAEALQRGDVGTVVHVYRGGQAFEVEFLTLSGETVAVTTLTAAQVRAVRKRAVAHARELAVA